MTDLDSILRQPAGPSRTAALAAWFQGLYPAGSPVPILVGGAAVELYTGGGYTTGDLDFVGTVPSVVDSILRSNGFERRGRHWVHDAGQVFFELPGRQLEPPSEPVRLEVRFSRRLAGRRATADELRRWTEHS